jgi:exodeoxyribonuclease-3
MGKAHRTQDPRPEESDYMRVATWNVNGLRSRLGFLILWLRERRPDIVGIQELKVEEDKFPRLELEAEGYHSLVHGQRSWNGVAILSREPGELAQRGLPGQEEAGARLVTARFEELSFSTIYVPNGKSVDHEDFPRKLAWLDTLAEHTARALGPQRSAIVCGDFNLCPTELDTWHETDAEGRIFHTQDERSRFRRLLDLGLRDTFRQIHPSERRYSWWDYRGGAFHKNHGLRIDLLLATPPVVARIRRVEIDREYRKKKEGMTASDHAPVIADLD